MNEIIKTNEILSIFVTNKYRNKQKQKYWLCHFLLLIKVYFYFLNHFWCFKRRVIYL